MVESASLDVKVLSMGDQTNAGPAFGFHLVEVFKAGKIGGSIRTSGFSSLLADGVGGSNIIDTGNLHGFCALLRVSEEGEEGQKSNNND
jgi:hypothetical protein